GVSRFLLPTFLCGRQRKVGAAPHRGNANRPIRNQGKAKRPKDKMTKRPEGQRQKASSTNPPSRQKPLPAAKQPNTLL
ncbi:hypothetical protein, partial [Paraburkholderia fungorum]|uniref:hypothetical protein n=1 Tax=Paraburkholderia fungorum TaxID=134537 RepID=UPI001C3F3A6B